MMETLGVGRTTLREALRLLETRGMLTIRSGPGGGPVVRRPSPEDLGEPLALMLQFQNATLIDVMEARGLVEAAIARAAAENITPAQIEELSAINARIEEVGPGNEPEFAAANFNFHKLIAGGAGNVVLTLFLDAIQLIADGRMMGLSYTPEVRRVSAIDHQAIIEALAAGDPDAADLAMQRHMETPMAFWRREYPDLVARPIRWQGDSLGHLTTGRLGDLDPNSKSALTLGASRRVRKTSELVAEDLVQYIIREELAEGTKLQPEAEMADSLGIGRTTLREALRLLESRGLLTIRAGPGGGPIVRYPTPANLGEGLALNLQFESVTGSDLINARIALEGAVAQAAARVATTDDIAQLRRAHEDVFEVLDNESDFLELNRRFHEALTQCSGNGVLEMYVDALLTIGDGHALGATYDKSARLGVHAAHTRILNAVESRDPEAAEAAMRQHLREAENYWKHNSPQLLSQAISWSDH